MLTILTGIRGEFAFIAIDLKKGTILFGRDRLGRRSLLISASPRKEIKRKS